MTYSPITSWQIDREKMKRVADFTFLGFKTTANGDCSHDIERHSFPGRKPRLKHHLNDKAPCSQSYGFSSSHVRMWELDHKEGWAPKNWCFWNVVLEKTLKSPLDCKEIKPVNAKGINPEYSWKDWCWRSNTSVTWWKELTQWNRLRCWERPRAGREGDNGRWDGWMAPPTQ